MSELFQIKVKGAKVMHRVVDNYRHTVLTSTYTSALDNHATLHIATRSPKGMAQAARLVLVANLLLFLTVTPAVANNDVKKNIIITYAGTILTPLELSAALKLWERESHWNPRARSGSHYGLCQGKSVWLSKQGYKNQVRWCIAYAWHRYGTMVGAYKAYLVKGWH